MTSEQAECDYLLQLCREAQRQEEWLRAPRPEKMRCLTGLVASRRAALKAARVIEAKRGKALECLHDPACDFIERAKEEERTLFWLE